VLSMCALIGNESLSMQSTRIMRETERTLYLSECTLTVILHFSTNFSSLLVGYKIKNFWSLKNFSVL